MERGASGAPAHARRRLRLRRPRPRLRHVLEIMMGVLLANVGDAANVFISAYFAWALRSYPIILALLPGLANLRGGNMSAMAARISTRLHLGVEKPSVPSALRSEAAASLIASLVAGSFIALIAAEAAGVRILRAIGAAGVSSAIVLAVMIPFTASVAVWVYRKGLNPDNVAAPILTVAGDTVSIPSLVAAALLLDSPASEGVAAFTTLWAAMTGLVLAFRLGGRLSSIVRDISLSMLVTAFIESAAGGLLSRFRGILYAAGVIHVAASLLEDTGASSSVIASRSATLLHLYGTERTLARAPSMVVEASLGTLPSLLILTCIGVAWGRMLGLPVSLGRMLVVLVGGGSIVVIVGSTLAVLVALLAYKARLDPDNAALPLTTALVDLVGSISLVAFTTLLI
jgi:mgtE-like transporter